MPLYRSSFLTRIVLAASHVLAANDDVGAHKGLDDQKRQLIAQHEAFLSAKQAGEELGGEGEGFTVDRYGQLAEKQGKGNFHGVLFALHFYVPLFFHRVHLVVYDRLYCIIRRGKSQQKGKEKGKKSKSLDPVCDLW